MAEDGEPSNACCAALKKKYLKLQNKYSRTEELKNKFRDCAELGQERYDVIERENGSLKQERDELQEQVRSLKDERDKESGAKIDLEDEVSALNDEIRLLKQKNDSFSPEANKQLQERLDAAGEEIKRLKRELLEKEKKRAALEKKNAVSEKKRADEALKMVEMEKTRGIEANEVLAMKEEIQLLKQNNNSLHQANKQLKEELLEKEKRSADLEKNYAELEKKRADEALKVVEMEKTRAIEAGEVSTLKDEIQLLKQNCNSLHEANKLLQECLSAKEREIGALETMKAEEALKKVEMGKNRAIEECLSVSEAEIMNKMREMTALEKKNTELETRIADEALKMAKMEKARAIEAAEVSALKDEIQLLKQNSNSLHDELNKQFEERLNAAEEENKKLKELLNKEKERTALEQKNAKLEKKKADKALKKVEIEKTQAVEAQKAEKKRADEYRILWEKLKVETDSVKSMLALEKCKLNAAEKKMEAEKKNVVTEAQNAATVERKRAEDNRILLEKLKAETVSVKSVLALEKSKLKDAEKKLEAEKQSSIRERKRADLAVAKAEEQRQLAESNLQKAMCEKDRADGLNQKFEAARERAEKLEESCKCRNSGNPLEHQSDDFNANRSVEVGGRNIVGTLNNDVLMSRKMEMILMEKDHIIMKEKKRADLEKKIAKKQKKVAKDNKKIAKEQKHRADKLSGELKSYKLKLEELQKELERSVSYKNFTGHSPLGFDNVRSETDTIKMLKKQLKLEKMLVKHAKKASKVEALQNKMLNREISNLKQQCHQFQQRLEILDDCFLHSGEGTRQLEKIDDQTTRRKRLCSDGYHGQLISGIDSGLDPPYRGYNPKMLKRSAINSSSASFSDRDLVGSQERGTSSITTSAQLGEDLSNLRPTLPRLSDQTIIRYNKDAIAKTDSRKRDPVKDSAIEGRVGYQERNRMLDAIVSIEKLYGEGEKLQQQVSEKLSLIHDIFNCQRDDPKNELLEKNSCGDLVRHFKRKRTSSDETLVIHRLQGCEESKGALDLVIDHSDGGIHTSSPQGFDHSDGGSSQAFDKITAHDCLKLLALDNADDENCYCTAIAMPLSPTLPTVELNGDDELECDNSGVPVVNCSEGGMPCVRANVASTSSLHVTNMEENAINVVSNDLVYPQGQTGHCSNVILKYTNSLEANHACFQHIDSSGGVSGTSDLSGSMAKEADSSGELLRNVGNNLGSTSSFHATNLDKNLTDKNTDLLPASNVSLVVNIAKDGLRPGSPDLSGSRAKETHKLWEAGLSFRSGAPLQYYFVSSDNKDNESILKIIQTIDSCLSYFSSVKCAETFFRSILDALLKAENTSTKEKACVIVSLILNGVCEIGLEKTNIFSDDYIQPLNSAMLHIFSGLRDQILRKIFMESCDLFELLSAVEDFLMQRKVLVCGDASSKSEVLCSSNVNLVLNGKVLIMSEVVAADHLLIAGGSFLSSLCLAVGHIDRVCEVSRNIITTQKFDLTLILAILHVFAHVCGSEYLTNQQDSLAMTLIKSLVTFVEKKASSKLASSSPVGAGNQSTVWLCSSNCPFIEGAVSMEDVALQLLDNLQVHAQSELWLKDSLETLLVPGMQCNGDTTDEISGSSQENFLDILSLFELLTSVMSWDWMFDHVICKLSEFLESHLMEGFSSAIITSLGRLGRLGVVASGYQDVRVEKLRTQLTGFMCKDTFMKLSLSVQFAIVTFFVSLSPVKIEDIIEDRVEEDNPAGGLSIPVAAFTREWFSQLNSEQQSFFKLLQDSF